MRSWSRLPTIILGLALLPEPGMASPRTGMNDSIEIRVVSRDARSPVESRIEFSRVGAPGTWLVIGTTSGGVLRASNPCTNGGMLRASPTDRAYRQSIPYGCSQTSLVIRLQRLGSSDLAVVTPSCVDKNLAFSRRATRPDWRIQTTLMVVGQSSAQNVSPFKNWSFRSAEGQLETGTFPVDVGNDPTLDAAPVWIKTIIPAILRAFPDDASEQVISYPVGTPLIPTGQVIDDWWQVTDTFGLVPGWIRTENFMLTPSKSGPPLDPCPPIPSAPIGAAPEPEL